MLAVLSSTILVGCASVDNMWSSSESKQRDEKLAAIIFSDDADLVQPLAEEGDVTPESPIPSSTNTVADTKSIDNDALPVFKSDAELAKQGKLQFWEIISGGNISSNWAMDLLTGDRTIKFVRPTAVCVRGDLVYVVDMGLHAVLRYNRVTGNIDKVLDLGDKVSGDVADIFVAKDLSFYITDTYGSRVLRFSHNGDLQRVYKNKLNLVRPVSVVEDDATGSILVADGEFDHILVFNQVGDPYTTIGRRGEEPGEFLSITAMRLTSENVFVASRVAGKIQVLSRDGEYLYSMEQDVMRFPLSLEVGAGRIYSSDYLDNTIKIFERGLFVESAGGTGRAPGKFKRITDLWLEDDFLFVVDSLNARIQVMKVVGASSSALPSLGP